MQKKQFKIKIKVEIRVIYFVAFRVFILFYLELHMSIVY